MHNKYFSLLGLTDKSHDLVCLFWSKNKPRGPHISTKFDLVSYSILHSCKETPELISVGSLITPKNVRVFDHSLDIKIFYSIVFIQGKHKFDMEKMNYADFICTYVTKPFLRAKILNNFFPNPWIKPALLKMCHS